MPHSPAVTPPVRRALAVAALGAAALAACGTTTTTGDDAAAPSSTSTTAAPSTTAPTSSTPSTTLPAATYVQELEVGDCFDDPSIAAGAAAEVLEVTAVADCATPHDGEVYAIVDVAAGPDDPYPAPEALEATVEAECMAGFETFVGVPWVLSPTLDIYAYRPTERSWTDDGDRAIVCAVVRLDRTKITGTTQGTAQ